jgi:hypothetical protein
MKILSIDAWHDTEGGWSWNNWFHVGDIDKATFESLRNNRAILKWFRDNGYITAGSAGKVSVEDDGYNVIVYHRSTFEPLFAIKYGPEY